MEASSSATSRAWKLRLWLAWFIKDIPLSSGRRAIDAVGMRTVTRVYRPYEILKGIRHCRLPGFSRGLAASRHSYLRERLLLTEFFKNSSHPSFGRRLQSLSVPLSLIGDPLSSRINRALSRRKADTRERNVASFYLFARRVYRIFSPLSLSFSLSLFPIFRFSVGDTSLNVDKSARVRAKGNVGETIINACSSGFRRTEIDV